MYIRRNGRHGKHIDIMADYTAHVAALPPAMSLDDMFKARNTFKRIEIAQRRPTTGNLSRISPGISPDVVNIILKWFDVLCLADREVWKKAASVSPEQAPRVSVAKKPRSVQRLSNAARPKARRLFALVPDE